MPWEKIRNLYECNLVSPPGNTCEFFLLKNADQTNWLVGQYKDLTKFASALRHDHSLQEFLYENRVRIGFRITDILPMCERQKNYGATVKGEDHGKDFTKERLAELAKPVQSLMSPTTNRLTDRKENVKTFWHSQTSQSHHIVEFNHLESLQASCRKGNGSMDYLQLPAVLLAAEFHQLYISAFLKTTHKWEREKLEAEIHVTYSRIYLENGQLFKPLWSVAEAIIEKAKVNS